MLYGKSVVVASLITGFVGLPIALTTAPVVAQPLGQSQSPQQAEGDRLLEQGIQQFEASQYEAAVKSWEQTLVLYRQISDSYREAGVLMNLGNVYGILSQYEKAISSLQDATHIFKKINDHVNEARALNNLGITYRVLSQYEKAITYHQEALTKYQQAKNNNGEANALINLGVAYKSLTQYEKAILYYQQALPILEQVNDRRNQARALNGIGIIYLALSLHEKAIPNFQQALSIYRATNALHGQAEVLGNIGNSYLLRQQYKSAIAYYQQALPIFQRIQDRKGEAIARMNIGSAYTKLFQYKNSINYLEQSLSTFRQINNRNEEALAAMNLGNVYLALGQYGEAITYYQLALPDFQQVKDREGEGNALNNLGKLYAQRRQLEVAIAFYKQSVNVRQTIREGIRNLPRDDQEAYTKWVSGTYRELANLLLAQGRIAEAQQVLELLKLQELREFARETRTTDAPASIALDQSETEILKAHSTLVAFAQTLRQCADDVTCARSPRLQVLTAQRDRQNLAFANLIKTLETQLRRETLTDRAFINPNDPNNGFRQRAEAILNSQPGTLLIYPLLLEDKMWLLVGSPGPVFTRYEVKVSQKQLAETILQFRTEMRRCEVNPCTPADTQRVKQISQKLYQWMFPPQLQKELQAIAGQPIRNLVFAPDRSTRYIPMGALFDGDKYLIERYTVSTIVAASLTDTRDRLSPQSTVLAMGVSDPVSGFSALPNVPLELDAIVKTKQGQDSQGIFPGTQFLNQTFTKPTLQTQLPGHEILHLATHAKFEPGALEQSFLLLGNGDRFMAPDIRQLQALPRVHLVVLSACETALGGRRDQDGMEIAGLNNAFLERGAKAVIASLWQVNDPSTSVWMQQFYHHLAQGHLTKSQAIQAVQLNFIHGKVTLQDLPNLRAGARRLVERDRSVDFSHPYYWAPFILVGNAL